MVELLKLTVTNIINIGLLNIKSTRIVPGIFYFNNYINQRL